MGTESRMTCKLQSMENTVSFPQKRWLHPSQALSTEVSNQAWQRIPWVALPFIEHLLR